MCCGLSLRRLWESTLGSVGSGILAGVALTLALNTILVKWADKRLARSDHSPGGNPSAELGIWDCLRNTAAARLRTSIL